VYISAGWDEVSAKEHPEWRAHDRYPWTPYKEPGYTNLCFNTGYLDLLIEQTKEIVSSFDLDGLFFDVCTERVCLCGKCLADMKRRGIDTENDAEILPFAREVYAGYYRSVNEAIHAIKPGLPIFHNCGHIRRGRRDLVASHTHLELESLPTGGWGYDHFPLSVAYAQQFGKEILGQTGKFHTHWGEFGGYKAVNALIYESALMIANGAKCSVGDQLHPLGAMDEATYKLIGAAYERVEEREAYCDGAERIADVGLLSQEAMQGVHNHPADVGANRVLLEGHYLYRVLDAESDFTDLKAIILPDTAALNETLVNRLRDFANGGGKLLASGVSGLHDGAFAFDFGCAYAGKSAFEESFIDLDFAEDFPAAIAVLYGRRHRLDADESAVLAYGCDPYFNRTKEHFCSHQHAPANHASRRPGIAEGRDGIYIGWDIFEDYAKMGSVTTKKTVVAMLDRLLGENKRVTTSLPAQGIVTLTAQRDRNRYVSHFLYASPVRRGEKFEVIEDVNPLHGIAVRLKTDERIRRVYLAPEQEPLDFLQSESGGISFVIPTLWCHAVVVLEY
ncbi:MAG: beta-galactosidase trimerization domain-containing protein, partial [Clostridiales Family XIII bacterium]|jgi:hypothetical protein|nr:beta-galactosidase trimerization domain-containing protein [Clostridiales Family XIII bacterium]